MTELLFEVFSEEIPARMQLPAQQALFDWAKKEFTKAGITFSIIETFVSTRRLVLHADRIALHVSDDDCIYKKGPAVDEPAEVVAEFAASLGIAAADLIKKKVKAKECFFARLPKPTEDFEDVLKRLLERLLHEFSWPKSMRWDNTNVTWARPIRNLLCLLGGQVLPVRYGNLVANDISFGHRFLAPEQFQVSSFKAYEAELKQRFVILSLDAKRQEIQSQIAAKLAPLNIQLIEDAGLLDEVIGLVEWPYVLLGQMHRNFLALPREVVISVMRTHQKYFAVERQDGGELEPYFIFVSNQMADPARDQTIITGNQRVLAARLSDAKFLFDEDRQQSLAARVDALRTIIFHERLGTVFDKVVRVQAIVLKLIELWNIKIADADVMARAALLAKVDLVTNLVREFPELQGVIGSHYALLDGEEPAVVRAICEHYLPQGKSGEYPETAEGSLLAIADRLDTLVGLFVVGGAPTSSKDPYALRRQALGIVKIASSFGITVDFNAVVRMALALFVEQVDERLVATIIEFLYNRFKFMLKDEFRSDLIEAVLRPSVGNIAADYQKLVCLAQFLSDEDGHEAFLSIKRVINITKSATNGHKATVNQRLFTAPEHELYHIFKQAYVENENFLRNFLYDEALNNFIALSDVIEEFFDEVMVMDENPELRKNRLALLADLNILFLAFADFSCISV